MKGLNMSTIQSMNSRNKVSQDEYYIYQNYDEDGRTICLLPDAIGDLCGSDYYFNESVCFRPGDYFLSGDTVEITDEALERVKRKNEDGAYKGGAYLEP
jgi:hypothetical protein